MPNSPTAPEKKTNFTNEERAQHYLLLPKNVEDSYLAGFQKAEACEMFFLYLGMEPVSGRYYGSHSEHFRTIYNSYRYLWDFTFNREYYNGSYNDTLRDLMGKASEFMGGKYSVNEEFFQKWKDKMHELSPEMLAPTFTATSYDITTNSVLINGNSYLLTA